MINDTHRASISSSLCERYVYTAHCTYIQESFALHFLSLHRSRHRLAVLLLLSEIFFSILLWRKKREVFCCLKNHSSILCFLWMCTNVTFRHVSQSQIYQSHFFLQKTIRKSLEILKFLVFFEYFCFKCEQKFSSNKNWIEID